MKPFTRFPLSHFDEIVPVLLQCFPEFWSERLQRNERSFPYDLKLFTAKDASRIIGTAGLHDYHFLVSNPAGRYWVFPSGGVCDLGVIPEMRGRGVAGKLQEFLIDYAIAHDRKLPMLPLYTDKPAVYTRRGWFVYEPDRSQEIPTADFPMVDAFRIDVKKIRYKFLTFKDKIPTNAEEAIYQKIHNIYRLGRVFPGKVMRSAKTWQELFSDPAYQWRLEEKSYFLYARGRLIEAYSADPAHPVNGFTPVNGNFEHNVIMLNLPDVPVDPAYQSSVEALRAQLRSHALQFPAADVF